jgi:hypothetical protein
LPSADGSEEGTVWTPRALAPARAATLWVLQLPLPLPPLLLPLLKVLLKLLLEGRLGINLLMEYTVSAWRTTEEEEEVLAGGDGAAPLFLVLRGAEGFALVGAARFDEVGDSVPDTGTLTLGGIIAGMTAVVVAAAAAAVAVVITILGSPGCVCFHSLGLLGLEEECVGEECLSSRLPPHTAPPPAVAPPPAAVAPPPAAAAVAPPPAAVASPAAVAPPPPAVAAGVAAM